MEKLSPTSKPEILKPFTEPAAETNPADTFASILATEPGVDLTFDMGGYTDKNGNPATEVRINVVKDEEVIFTLSVDSNSRVLDRLEELAAEADATLRAMPKLHQMTQAISTISASPEMLRADEQQQYRRELEEMGVLHANLMVIASRFTSKILNVFQNPDNSL